MENCHTMYHFFKVKSQVRYDKQLLSSIRGKPGETSVLYCTVQPVLNGTQKKTRQKDFKTEDHLMQVKSIAECSREAFCNTLELH